jgi:hypothetical protein
MINMVNMTLAVPKELKDEMDIYPWVNWSEVARMAIRERLRELKVLEEFRSDSEITEEDSIELGKKVKKALYKRYQESHG